MSSDESLARLDEGVKWIKEAMETQSATLGKIETVLFGNDNGKGLGLAAKVMIMWHGWAWAVGILGTAVGAISVSAAYWLLGK